MQYEILWLNLQSRRALRQNVIIYKLFSLIGNSLKTVYLMFSVNFKRCLCFKFDIGFKQDAMGRRQQKLKMLDNAQKILLWLRHQPERLSRLSPQTIVEKDAVSPLWSCCTSVYLCIVIFSVLITQHATRWHELRDKSLFIVCVRLVRGWLTSVAAVNKYEERSVETCLLRISHHVPPAGSLFDAFIFSLHVSMLSSDHQMLYMYI